MVFPSAHPRYWPKNEGPSLRFSPAFYSLPAVQQESSTRAVPDQALVQYSQ